MRQRIDTARTMLRYLEVDRPQPTTSNAAKLPGDGVGGLDARLTAIRVESRAALGVALVAGSRSQEARRLRDDIQFERLRTISGLTDLASPGQSAHARVLASVLARLRRPSLTSWPLRAAAPAIVGVVGAVAVVGVALALVVLLAGDRDSIPSGAIGANFTPTPEGAVAGNRMATPTAAPSTGAVEVGGGAMTFDDLVMGRPLPRSIDRLVRGGRAEVAAVPNAVDRSLRLVSLDGTPAMVCRQLSDTAPYAVVAELLAPAPYGQRLVLRREKLEATEAGIEIGEEGTLRSVPDGSALGSIPPGEWLVVEMVLDPSGSTLEITTSATQGGAAAWVQVAAAAGWVGAARTEFCVSSPAATDGEIYVNNLRIH